MKSTLRAILAAIILPFLSGPAMAAPYPDAEQLQAAIALGGELLAGAGMGLEVRDARREGLALSLLAAGLDLDSGRCVVYFNAEPAALLRDFFAGLEERDMPVWLGAFAVHEATHCIEQREAYLRLHFDKVLPPDLPHAGMTLRGYLSVVKSGAVETWGEALGDIASILYLRQAEPARWRFFARGIAGLRRDLASRAPEHDTTGWLDKLIAAGDEAGSGDVFETAFRLRQRFRPD